MSDTPRKVPPEYAHIPAYAYEDLWEYHLAVSGEGPHAYTWEDKPHRLVFGLTARCADLRRENAALRATLEDQRDAMKDLSGCKTSPDAEWLRGFALQCIAAIDAAIAQGKA